MSKFKYSSISGAREFRSCQMQHNLGNPHLTMTKTNMPQDEYSTAFCARTDFCSDICTLLSLKAHTATKGGALNWTLVCVPSSGHRHHFQSPDAKLHFFSVETPCSEGHAVPTKKVVQGKCRLHFLHCNGPVCSNTLFSNTSASTNLCCSGQILHAKVLEHLVWLNTFGLRFWGPLARTNVLSALCGLPTLDDRQIAHLIWWSSTLAVNTLCRGVIAGDLQSAIPCALSL